ncbi:MAG: restriction endonuclease [Candidatus Brocadiia bacterium]
MPNDNFAENDRFASRDIADLIVAGDNSLDRFYKQSILCLIIVGVAVAALLADIAFLSLSGALGLALYYGALGIMLLSLLYYLYAYGQFYVGKGVLQIKLDEARKRLVELQQVEELKEKVRQRIERMRSEAAWFSLLQAPGAIEMMDNERNADRGNEEFEYFVRKFFEKMGFRIDKTSVVAETGVYMLVSKDGKQHLIFPVHPPTSVDGETLREFNKELMSTNVESAIVVTSGTFNENARAYVDKRNFLLYDITTLQAGLKGVVAALNARAEEEQKMLSESDPAHLLAALSDRGSHSA